MIISITIAVDAPTKLLYHQVRSRLLAVQFSVLTTKNNVKATPDLNGHARSVVY